MVCKNVPNHTSPFLSICLTKFAPIQTMIIKISSFFFLFPKILWSFKAVKWHFPSVPVNSDWKYVQEVPRKKNIKKKNPGVTGRWSLLIMWPHLSLVFIFWKLTWSIIVKTWENISLSLYHWQDDVGSQCFTTRPKDGLPPPTKATRPLTSWCRESGLRWRTSPSPLRMVELHLAFTSLHLTFSS